METCGKELWHMRSTTPTFLAFSVCLLIILRSLSDQLPPMVGIFTAFSGLRKYIKPPSVLTSLRSTLPQTEQGNIRCYGPYGNHFSSTGKQSSM